MTVGEGPTIDPDYPSLIIFVGTMVIAFIGLLVYMAEGIKRLKERLRLRRIYRKR